ncbi:HAD family hydrolase [Mycoplasma hafezii]|uniref:HAD family hydrolase n=1 Tax=Mycoplasma hafezii TaxID=525886 RepID=UPI003CECB3D2
MDKKKNNLETFIFDLDGTLLNSQKEVTKRTKQAIELLHKQGKRVVIATGRPFYMNKKLFTELNLKDPVIAINGTTIIDDWRTGKTTVLGKLDNTEVLQIVKYLEANKIDFLTYTTDTMYGENFNNPIWFNARIYPYTTADNPYRWNYEETSVSQLIEQNPNITILKLLILREKVQDKMPKLLEFLKQFPKSYCIPSQSDVLDIMPLHQNKGKAIKELFKKYGWKLAEAIACGDAPNDVEMMQAVAVGVAMANAHPEVKEHADIIAESNDEDGVAKLIEQILLG